MIDPSQESPVFFWERTKIEVVELTNEQHETGRLLHVQVAMRRVPAVPGKEGMETRPPPMYIHVEAAEDLAKMLMMAVSKARLTQTAPKNKQ